MTNVSEGVNREVQMTQSEKGQNHQEWKASMREGILENCAVVETLRSLSKSYLKAKGIH